MKKAILIFLLIIFATPIYAGCLGTNVSSGQYKSQVNLYNCDNINSGRSIELLERQTGERYNFKVRNLDGNRLSGYDERTGEHQIFELYK